MVLSTRSGVRGGFDSRLQRQRVQALGYHQYLSSNWGVSEEAHIFDFAIVHTRCGGVPAVMSDVYHGVADAAHLSHRSSHLSLEFAVNEKLDPVFCIHACEMDPAVRR